MAEHQGEPLEGPALLVPVAIDSVDGCCPAQQPRRGCPIARGEFDARPDAQEPGPFEVVAGAALKGEAGLPQRGPGGVELVREP